MKGVFETPEFKRLQAEWYGKLKADGFVDIELEDPADDSIYQDLLKLREVRRYRTLGEASAELYTMAQRWLHRARWRSRRERFYWNEWAYGATLVDIHGKHPVDSGITYSRFKEIHRELRADMFAECMLTDAQAAELVEDPNTENPEDWL
jgi:hypothetical protein